MRTLKKIPGGKLLELEWELDGDAIKHIRITGDFFAHPEWCIEEIEKALVGVNVSDAQIKVDEQMIQKNFQIIGFSSSDLQSILGGR
ncbi:MAG TPA: lipoate protein ligase C-terminal domain-containing protein [archaeon]|nr:lipoate protein ligase C-terminal domain-containing protein [archaeon]